MADKIIAPVGSRFLLRWTTDAYVELENHFQVNHQGVKRVEITRGMPPRKGNMVKGKLVPVPLRGKVTALLTIQKDGEESGYRDQKLEPLHEEKLKFPEGKYLHEYTFVFVARQEGEYVFKIEFTFEPSPAKTALTAPPTLLKEVQVVPGAPTNDRRKDMLALIDKWLPSAVMQGTNVPPGESRDILARCGWNMTSSHSWEIPKRYPDGPTETLPKAGNCEWTQAGRSVTTDKGQGQIGAAIKSYNLSVLPGRQAAYDALSKEQKAGHERPDVIPVVTSCISVMSELVVLWGNEFKADLETMTNPNPAYYVKASEEYAKASPTPPKPGDILYLVKPDNRGFFQHVCILVSSSSEVWSTADGGGGALPEQTATVVNKPLSWTADPHPIPMFASVTDGAIKVLHGWVDLDKVPNSKYHPDGSRK